MLLHAALYNLAGLWTGLDLVSFPDPLCTCERVWARD